MCGELQWHACYGSAGLCVLAGNSGLSGGDRATIHQCNIVQRVYAFRFGAGVDLMVLSLHIIAAEPSALDNGALTMAKHPGFKAVAQSIARRQGVGKAAASAELAASSRNASAAAKKKNPRLRRVKG